jgi:hypothetical protein
LFHWHTLSLFRANQSLLLLIKAVSLAEKQQIGFGASPPGSEPERFI